MKNNCKGKRTGGGPCFNNANTNGYCWVHDDQKPVKICEYCEEPAVLVTGKVIYPHRPDLAKKKIWYCAPCKAYVGCHRDGITPLGRLADEELRKAKMAAHAAFDPKWKTGRLTRSQAYIWLAEKLNIPEEHCHIGMFDKTMCQRVVKLCKKRRHSR